MQFTNERMSKMRWTDCGIIYEFTNERMSKMGWTECGIIYEFTNERMSKMSWTKCGIIYEFTNERMSKMGRIWCGIIYEYNALIMVIISVRYNTYNWMTMNCIIKPVTSRCVHTVTDVCYCLWVSLILCKCCSVELFRCILLCCLDSLVNLSTKYWMQELMHIHTWLIVPNVIMNYG